jgi:UDP-GlcNAc:undecaprenyl-phosphate GlcNAc-1-phosphate transferase
MPGYGGKTIAGFMLAVLAILSSAKLGTALLVLTVPMIDATFIFIRRILSGKSPVWASSGHLHHHLLKLGWGKRRIAVFYWLISAITGVIALSVNSTQKIFVGIAVGVLVLGFIIWVNFAREKIKVS